MSLGNFNIKLGGALAFVAAVIVSVVPAIALEGINAASWRDIKSTGASFSFKMPGTTEVKTEEETTRAGTIKKDTYSVEIRTVVSSGIFGWKKRTNGVAMMVRIMDFSRFYFSGQDVERIPQAACLMGLEPDQVRNVKITNIKLGKHPGCEIQGETDGTHYIQRVFVVKLNSGPSSLCFSLLAMVFASINSR